MDIVSNSDVTDTVLLLLVGVVIGGSCAASILLARLAMRLRQVSLGRAYSVVNSEDAPEVVVTSERVQPNLTVPGDLADSGSESDESDNIRLRGAIGNASLKG